MDRLSLIARNQRQLLRRREQLHRAYSNELANLGLDEDEESLDDEQYFQTAEAESRELREIDGALQRIRDGIYGQCEDCGEPISETRIKALPLVTLCLECKKASELEHRNPMFA